MDRIPEPELMEDEEQARAYASADFDEPHSRFIRLLREAFPEEEINGCVLDLGCGPGDIAIRMARAYPRCNVLGIDGSEAMLRRGEEILSHLGMLASRIEFKQAWIPFDKLPQRRYSFVISNSLLHHLDEPAVLWLTIKEAGRPGTPVFIMDLMRPASVADAHKLVEAYSGGEPEILRRDFFASLLAAYDIEEIGRQLRETGMEQLTVSQVSDRHLLVSGRLS